VGRVGKDLLDLIMVARLRNAPAVPALRDLLPTVQQAVYRPRLNGFVNVRNLL
jgi:hypothetical protein